MDGGIEGWWDRWMEGLRDGGWMDGGIEGWMEGWTISMCTSSANLETNPGALVVTSMLTSCVSARLHSYSLY